MWGVGGGGGGLKIVLHDRNYDRNSDAVKTCKYVLGPRKFLYLINENHGKTQINAKLQGLYGNMKPELKKTTTWTPMGLTPMGLVPNF